MSSPIGGGAVARVVGIGVGVISRVINLDSSDIGDSLNYSSIISVYTGPDEATAPLIATKLKNWSKCLPVLAASLANRTASSPLSSVTRSSSLALKRNLRCNNRAVIWPTSFA